MSSLILLAAPRYLALLRKGFIYESACRALRLHARCCTAQRGLPTKIRTPIKARDDAIWAATTSRLKGYVFPSVLHGITSNFITG